MQIINFGAVAVTNTGAVQLSSLSPVTGTIPADNRVHMIRFTAYDTAAGTTYVTTENTHTITNAFRALLKPTSGFTDEFMIDADQGNQHNLADYWVFAGSASDKIFISAWVQ